ncbi:MAG: ferrous iron transport protein B [Candidatus Zixiibacteriota bacterium]|nr:MAG: ferrous iron transport protein B [candidate division Zixibacteria bacterium]
MSSGDKILAEAKERATNIAPVILIGNPNVGKSALFGALSGRYVEVSNYPGTTVDYAAGWIKLKGEKIRLFDSPGADSLSPVSEDEIVTRDLLLLNPDSRIICVADSKNLKRGLVLLSQLAEFGRKVILALNMADEAKLTGINIDNDRLAEILGIPVVSTVATQRRGIERLKEALHEAAVPSIPVDYNGEILTAVNEIEDKLGDIYHGARGISLSFLSGDNGLPSGIGKQLTELDLNRIKQVKMRLESAIAEPLGFIIAKRRNDSIQSIVDQIVEAKKTTGQKAFQIIGQLSLHPYYGIPILITILIGIYYFVGVFGAQTLVGVLEENLFRGIINPFFERVFNLIPVQFIRDLFVGEFGIITMAVTYALALILPIVTAFFLVFGVLEDSGYLPRLAFMVDRIFKKIGLNGRAVLPMILGLGCDTMAVLTARILYSRKEKILVTLLLALAVPCSAQLGVTLGILASISLSAVLIWMMVIVAVIFLVGYLASKVIPGRSSEFILEIPPLRLPRIENIVVKTLMRLEWYLKEAVPLFILGTLVLFVLDKIKVLQLIMKLFAPISAGILGLPEKSAEAFILGFLRRDYGAAGFKNMFDNGILDPVGAIVAMTTITLFVPCIANFFIIIKERGLKTALLMVSLIVPFAITVGGILNLALRGFALW